MKWLIPLLLLASACTPTRSVGGAAAPTYAADGKLSLEYESGGPWSFTLVLEQCKECKTDQGTTWWGNENAAPEHAIAEVRVKHAGRDVAVPRSAYADLTNVRSASIEGAPNGFDLVINGGQSAASFVATLTFRNGALVKRTVASRLFPDNAYETTTYHQQWPEDM